MRLAAALLALLGAGGPAAPPAAPPARPDPIAAEKAFANALAAQAADDPAGYRAALERTMALLPDPTRLYYRLAAARLLAGDRPAAIDAFSRLVDAGIDRSPRQDALFAPLLADPLFTAALARMESLREPMVRSFDGFRLAEAGLLVEGIAHDPASGDWFLSAVNGRKVIRRDAAGALRDFVPAGAEGLAAPLALAVDGARRRLWVVSAGLPHARGLPESARDRSALLAFDLASGALVRRVDSPAGGVHLWNDLELAADGSLYVSDPGAGAIVHVREDGAVETLVAGVGLRSPGGLALSADGGRLYVADWSQGLAAVEIATRRLTWLAPPAGGATTLGIDGLRRVDNALVAIQNGVAPPRITRFALAPDGLALAGAETLERAHPDWDEPTLGTIVDGALWYVATSHWPRFGEDGAPQPGDELAPARVLRLPLP